MAVEEELVQDGVVVGVPLESGKEDWGLEEGERRGEP